MVAVAAVPVVYAAAMAAAALAALGTGWLHDRSRGRILLPFLVGAVPAMAFSSSLGVALLGVLIWGAASGVQDSTVKALVAQLVPAERRATGFGLFAAVQGVAAVAGGALAGALSERSVPTLAISVAVLQVAALVLLVVTLRREEP